MDTNPELVILNDSSKLLRIYFLFLISYLFCLFTFPMLSPFKSPLTEFFLPFCLPFTSEKVPNAPPSGIAPSEHQVSTGLDASSPTEVRQVSLLLLLCQGPQTNSNKVFSWWFILWACRGPGKMTLLDFLWGGQPFQFFQS